MGRVRVDLHSLNTQGASCILVLLSSLRRQGNSCSSVMQGLLPRRGDTQLPSPGVLGGPRTGTPRLLCQPLPPHAPQPLSGRPRSRPPQPGESHPRGDPVSRRGDVSAAPAALRTPSAPAAPSAALPNLLARQDREGCANSSGAVSPRWQR